MFTTFLSSPFRRWGLSLVAGMAATCMGMGAFGQSPSSGAWPDPSVYKPSPVKDKNAALEYMTIRELFDNDFLKLVSAQFNGNEATWVPSAEFTVLLEENQPLIRRLLEASKLPNYDFGIRYEDGFGAMLPHLGHLRTFSRLLGADARRLCLVGRTDEATERMLACVRISSHIVNDKVLISSLVSIAITQFAVNQAEIIARDFGMSEPSRRAFGNVAKSMLTDDPFGLRACLQMEKHLALNSIRPWYKGKGDAAGKDLAKELRTLQVSGDSLKAIEQMNEQQVDEQVDLLERYYVAMNNTWVAADAETRLKELEERLVKGEFGELLRQITPALSKARASLKKVSTDIGNVTALLEAGMSPPVPEPELIENVGE